MNKKILILIFAAVVLAGAILTVIFTTTQKTESYTVTFQDFDGTVLRTETVKSGEAATAPENPQREGYTFAGWDRAYTPIVKDTVIVAQYTRVTEAVFTVDTVTVSLDTQQVEIAVSVTNNPGILGMLFSVNYDQEALNLVDCENGVALSALTFQKPSRYKSGCNFLWYGSETGTVTDGEILLLTFEITDGANPGTYPIIIQWSEEDILDNNCDLLNPDVVQGGIVIPE